MTVTVHVIVIVEDKLEEQVAAAEAVKKVLGPEYEEVHRFEPRLGYGLIALGLVGGKGGYQIRFAPHLEWAKLTIEFAIKSPAATFDGVITDLMFPATKEGKEAPNGLQVIAQCIESAVPIVVCSDTDHHEVSYLRPIFPILAKAHPAGSIPVILDKKDWEQAVTLLFKFAGRQ
jgi:hypothetical protein